jgi:hypothetical protein
VWDFAFMRIIGHNIFSVMTVRTLILFVSVFFFLHPRSHAQVIEQPSSFDAVTYNDLLHLNFKAIADTTRQSVYKLKKGTYTRLMRSPEVGLYNRCEAYMRNDGVAVITLRGTINKPESWLENFLAAMVTATGSLQLTDSTVFTYQLAADSQAYVHAGWLIGLGFLAPYINPVMDSLLAAGTRSFIITGHSQGGALAFLTTSYLHYKYSKQYPDLRLTAYCSAAPKPGNLYYAYDFDFITRNNHGFRIVNTADWVPENPLAVQTVPDMKYPNPLADAKTSIRKQKFLVRLVLNSMYGKMKRSSERTMKRYRKYLGSFLFKQVHKTLPQLRQPDFVYSSNYMTAGTPVILPADSAYYRRFVFTGKNVFVHHNLDAYLYLLRKYY